MTAMSRAEKPAERTAMVPQAEFPNASIVQERALRGVGLVVSFVLLFVFGSIWAVSNVQYMDTLHAESAETILQTSNTLTARGGASDLVSQGR